MKGGKDPRYSTTDHWTQESVKRIFNSELFCAVGAAEKKTYANCYKYATFYGSCFNVFKGKNKNKNKIQFSFSFSKTLYCPH